MNQAHVSVLLHQSIEALNIKPDGVYLDATFGRGGHSRLVLNELGENGRLYAVDRDPQAASVAQQLTQKDSRFHFCHTPFSKMDSAFAEIAENTLDGVLFDLGVSSPQLDEAQRGFSFTKAGPLDMRMNPEVGQSAKEWLMATDETTLSSTIRDLGGETSSIAKRLAHAIINSRDKLKTTLDLAQVVSDAMPKKFYKPGHHPATQTFQAIRMTVNDEVGEINRGLVLATKLLKSGGVMVVITFHGLEDALVKRFIRSQEGEALPAEIPLNTGRMGQVLRLIPPVIKPSASEVAENPRSRSARLRKAEKI